MHNLNENTVFHQRYQLLSLLGSGAFSEVWKARDQKTGTIVAIKIFAPDKGIEQDGIEAFAEEFRNTSELMHPHILRANYFDVFEQSPYLVLPYCKGRSLSAWLAQKHPFSEQNLAELMFQIGSALAYIHQSKDEDSNIIVHKDIKPANILIKDERLGNYLLADFGISSRMKHTVARSVLGSSLDINSYNSFTPAYAPPEVSRSLPSPSGDVFSLGMTLLELLYGKPLPYAQPLGQILERTGSLPELPPISDRFSDSLCALVLACLEPDKHKRPAAADLAEQADYYLKNGHWKDKQSPTENISRAIVNNAPQNINDEEDTISIDKSSLSNITNDEEDTLAVPNKKSADQSNFDQIVVSKISMAESINEKSIPPPPTHKSGKIPPAIEESIEPKADIRNSGRVASADTNPDTPMASRLPKALMGAAAAAVLAIGAWMGGWFPGGTSAQTAATALWHEESIVKDLPETYRNFLSAYHEKRHPGDKNFILYSSNDWTLIDYQMGTGSQKSLACLLHDKTTDQAKVRLVIWHPDAKGQLELDSKISPIPCHECKGIIAQESVVPTVCAVDASAAATANPVTMPYAYLKTDEPTPRIIYRSKEGVLNLCYGK